MSIETDLVARLKATAAVTALVGSGAAARVYPLRLPESWTGAAGSALTYELVGGSRLYHLGGAAGVSRARVRLHCWSATYGGAKALAAAVRGALDDWAAEAASPVRSVFQEGRDIDLFDTDAPGPSGAYRTVVDWVLRFTES